MKSTVPTLPTVPKISAFNTGRLYTVMGQRIAWCVLPSGNVAMYDLDRMIDYVLTFPPGYNPTDRDVQRVYDQHGAYLGPDCRQNNVAPFVTHRADYDLARELQSALINAARAVAPIRR